MFKTLFFGAMLAALIPFIHTAQKMAAGYSHMQSTAAMLADPFVQRDYARFAACAAATQAEGNKLAGADGSHTIHADPSQCQHPTASVSDNGSEWLAVR